MSDPRNCWGSWIGVHKFEPRYDSILPREMESIKGNSTSIEAVKDKIYVRDICVRCGETVERSKGESQCATS